MIPNNCLYYTEPNEWIKSEVKAQQLKFHPLRITLFPSTKAKLVGVKLEEILKERAWVL